MPDQGASGEVEYEVGERGPTGRSPVLSRYARLPARSETEEPPAEAVAAVPEPPSEPDPQPISQPIAQPISQPKSKPTVEARPPEPKTQPKPEPAVLEVEAIRRSEEPAPARPEATPAPAPTSAPTPTPTPTPGPLSAEPSAGSEPRPARPERTATLVPMPAATEAEPPPGKKLPFWKRIAIPRSAPTGPAPPPQRMPSLDPVLSRLNALEKRLDEQQAAQAERLDRFEENITRLWELEEQLAVTEVRERLALLEANQEEIADGLHAVSRNLSILAVVLSLAVAAGLLTLGVAL